MTGHFEIERDIQLVQLKIHVAHRGIAPNAFEKHFRQWFGFQRLGSGRSWLWNFSRRHFPNVRNRLLRGRWLQRLRQAFLQLVQVDLSILVADHVDQGIFNRNAFYTDKLFPEERRNIEFHLDAIDRCQVFQQETFGIPDFDSAQEKPAFGHIDRESANFCVDARLLLHPRQHHFAHHLGKTI